MGQMTVPSTGIDCRRASPVGVSATVWFPMLLPYMRSNHAGHYQDQPRRSRFSARSACSAWEEVLRLDRLDDGGAFVAAFW